MGISISANGRITITYGDSISVPGLERFDLTPTMSEAEMRTRVRAAIDYAVPRVSPAHRDSIRGLRSRVNGVVRGHRRRVSAPASGGGGGTARAEPRPTPQPGREGGGARTGGGGRGGGTGRGRGAPRPAPEPEPVAQPTITADWITGQLRAAGGGGRGATRASSTLHRQSLRIRAFLTEDMDRSISRGPNHIATTIAIFNTLSREERFRVYLTAMAGHSSRYAELQQFVNAHGGQLATEGCGLNIIRAADSFIRRYLLAFVARREGGDAAYRRELEQIPLIGPRTDESYARGRLELIQNALELQGRGVDDETRQLWVDTVCNGPMDSATITAVALYMRRRDLRRGRGRRASAWTAPAELVPLAPPEAAAEETAETTAVERPEGEEQQIVPRPVARPGSRVTIPRPPRILAVTDSIGAPTAGQTMGRYTRTLMNFLQTHGFPDATAATEGRSGRRLRTMRTMLPGFLSAHPQANIIVLEGGLNDLRNAASADRVIGDFRQMIALIRRERPNALIVIPTLTPWFGSSNWNAEREGARARINQFIMSLRGSPDIVVADLSGLGETGTITGRRGSGFHYRDQYARRRADRSIDWLHPNSAGLDFVGTTMGQSLIAATITRQREEIEIRRDFAAELFAGATRGNPESVIRILRIPADETRPSQEDIQEAFISLFNEVLQDPTCEIGRDFGLFLSRTSHGSSITHGTTMLDDYSSDAERRTVATAVQAFANWLSRARGTIARRDFSWGERLQRDLRLLYDQALHLPDAQHEQIAEDGNIDIRTLAAIGVYTWRRGHRGSSVGHWGRNIGVTPEARETPPPQPEGPRRVIRMQPQ